MSIATGLFLEDVAGGSIAHSATSAILTRDFIVYFYAT
jgi:hypothetical protein